MVYMVATLTSLLPKNYFKGMHLLLIMQMSSVFAKNGCKFGNYQSSMPVILNSCNMNLNQGNVLFDLS